MCITSGSDLKGPKYIPCIREGEQRTHFIVLLDDHLAGSQGWTLARRPIFRHISTQSLYMAASLVILGSIETGVIDGQSVALHNRDLALQIDRVLHNQLLS